MKVTIGTVEVVDTEVEEPTRGITLGGEASSGSRRLFSVIDRAGLDLRVADFSWQNGERHVGVLSCAGPPQITRNLV